jgi:predicted Fe-Mo cluster-binding NifX family protein
MRAKIAVASNDGVSISKHFGRTSRFAVFEITSGQILAEESRTGLLNDRSECHCAGQDSSDRLPQDTRGVIAMLQDCRAVLCGGMGWRIAEEFVRHGINPLVIAGDLSPRVAVEHYLAGTLKAAQGFCRRPKLVS